MHAEAKPSHFRASHRDQLSPRIVGRGWDGPSPVTGSNRPRANPSERCYYFRRLADLDGKVLEALIAGSVAEVRRRYPHLGDG